MRRNQIDPAGAANLGFFMLEGDEEVRRDRHDFPRHQEQYGRPCQQDQHHTADESPEEQPTRGKRFGASIGQQIVGAVDRGQGGQSQQRQQEKGAQRIQSNDEGAVRGVPRESERQRLAAGEDAQSWDQAQKAGDNGDTCHPDRRKNRRHASRTLSVQGSLPSIEPSIRTCCLSCLGSRFGCRGLHTAGFAEDVLRRAVPLHHLLELCIMQGER